MIDHALPFTPAEKREANVLCDLLRTLVPHMRTALGSKMVILSEPGSRPTIALNADGGFLKIDWGDECEFLDVMEVVRLCPDFRSVLDRIEAALAEFHSPAAATVHRAKDALDSQGFSV